MIRSATFLPALTHRPTRRSTSFHLYAPSLGSISLQYTVSSAPSRCGFEAAAASPRGSGVAKNSSPPRPAGGGAAAGASGAPADTAQPRSMAKMAPPQPSCFIPTPLLPVALGRPEKGLQLSGRDYIVRERTSQGRTGACLVFRDALLMQRWTAARRGRVPRGPGDRMQPQAPVRSVTIPRTRGGRSGVSRYVG